MKYPKCLTFTITNFFLIKIILLFRKKNLELLKKVKKEISAFDYCSDYVPKNIAKIFYRVDFSLSLCRITNISVKEKRNIVHVNITLERPGMIIGKSGCVIDALTKYLSKELSKEVKIHLIESEIWNNLY